MRVQGLPFSTHVTLGKGSNFSRLSIFYLKVPPSFPPIQSLLSQRSQKHLFWLPSPVGSSCEKWSQKLSGSQGLQLQPALAGLDTGSP